MAELFKDRYNAESLRGVALDLQAAYPPFPVDAFLESTLDEVWDGLELKGRIHQISVNLRRYLPAEYREAIGVIDQVIGN